MKRRLLQISLQERDGKKARRIFLFINNERSM